MKTDQLLADFGREVKKTDEAYYGHYCTLGTQLRRWLADNLMSKISWPSVELAIKARECYHLHYNQEHLDEIERTMRINRSMGAPDGYDSDLKEVSYRYSRLSHFIRNFELVVLVDCKETVKVAANIYDSKGENLEAVMDRDGLIHEALLRLPDDLEPLVIRQFSDYYYFSLRKNISRTLRALLEDFDFAQIETDIEIINAEHVSVT